MGQLLYLLYFSLGPIYWLPGVGPTIFQILKISLFGSLMVRLLRKWIDGGMKIHATSAVFFVMVNAFFLTSSLLHGGYFQENNSIINYLLPLLLLCIVLSLPVAERIVIVGAVRCVPFCFVVVAIFVPLGLIFPSVNWPNPFYEGDYDFFIGQAYTGFGGSRTDWSVGSSFLTSIALMNILFSQGKKWILAILVFFVICSSIFIPGGRAGMIAIAVMIGTLILVSVILGRRLKTAAAMMLLLTALGFVVAIFADELRLDALLSGDVAGGAGGRMEGYSLAMDLFLQNPLFGVGAAGADLEGFGLDYNEIHNTVLNFATKFWILATIPVVAIFLWLIARMYHARSRIYDDPSIMSAVLVMVSAVVFVFTEPVVVFGNFHNTMIFWFIIGVSLGSSGRMMAPARHPPPDEPRQATSVSL